MYEENIFVYSVQAFWVYDTVQISADGSRADQVRNLHSIPLILSLKMICQIMKPRLENI